MDDPATPLDVEEAKKQLTELVLEHFGIPRPGRSRDLYELEDNLLPTFIRMARDSWTAAATMPMFRTVDDPTYKWLTSATFDHSEAVRRLDNILEEIGVNDLLRDLAVSPYVAALGSIPVDPYEERLLKASAHPNPSAFVSEILKRVAADASLIASPSDKLEQAALSLVRVHERTRMNEKKAPEKAPPKSAAPSPDTAKPKRRKLFTGLGSLFSGLVLLAGDGIFIPAVITTGGLAAVPLIASMAGGIAAVGKGAGDLNREGE